MEDNVIVIDNNTYRIKQMNAIEIFSVQTQIDYSSKKKAMEACKMLLELLEVQVKDQWLPVKAEDKEVYFPIGIENDLKVIPQLCKFVAGYFGKVFQKSNESKSKTE